MKKLNILIIILAGVFLAFMGYNASVALDHKYEVNGDAWDYIHLGLSIAKTGKYGHFKVSRDVLLADFKENEVKNKQYEYLSQTAFRPPLWPIIIAGIFLIFGYSLSFLIIFKFFLHLLGVIIFYRTLKLLKFGEVVLIIGTFVYGINPAWQLYSRVFLSEPITLFFITLWLYFLVRFIKGKSGPFPQALLGGILILSHPYYIFLPFSIWLMLYLKKVMKFKTFFASSVICASIVSIWIIRNTFVFNTNEIVLTTSSGAVMAKGWNLNVINEHTNTKGDLADEELVLAGYNYDINLPRNEIERMQLYKNAAFHFISSNPDLILPIIGTKLFSAFNPFPETPKPGILETGRWLFQFFALLSLFYILIFPRNKFFQSLTVGLILSTVGITILTYSGFRFRMPQVGLEMLLIAYVLNDILERRKSSDFDPIPSLD